MADKDDKTPPPAVNEKVAQAVAELSVTGQLLGDPAVRAMQQAMAGWFHRDAARFFAAASQVFLHAGVQWRQASEVAQARQSVNDIVREALSAGALLPPPEQSQ